MFERRSAQKREIDQVPTAPEHLEQHEKHAKPRENASKHGAISGKASVGPPSHSLKLGDQSRLDAQTALLKVDYGRCEQRRAFSDRCDCAMFFVTCLAHMNHATFYRLPPALPHL